MFENVLKNEYYVISLANKVSCLGPRSTSRNIILGQIQSLVMHAIRTIARSSALYVDKDSRIMLKYLYSFTFYCCLLLKGLDPKG